MSVRVVEFGQRHVARQVNLLRAVLPFDADGRLRRGLAIAPDEGEAGTVEAVRLRRVDVVKILFVCGGKAQTLYARHSHLVEEEAELRERSSVSRTV